MKKLLVAAFVVWGSLTTPAADLYPHFVQPPDPAGGLIPSSWWEPDGSDWDEYQWDNFVLPTAQSVTAITWRGGRTAVGLGGPVVDFQIRIYPSLGSQPDIVAGPLVDYSTGGNAGETPAGTVGGVAMKDYRFTLPVPFEAAAGVPYWVQITAAQHGIPDWGLAVGTRGNGLHIHLTPGTHQYLPQTGDIAFSLWTPDPVFTITTSNAPAGGGSTRGGGSYTNGSNVTVTATANPGYAFVNWTEGSTTVSTSASYDFVANANRILVANFGPQLQIAPSAPGAIVLSWPAPTSGYVLQHNSVCQKTNWVTTTNAVSVADGRNQVNLSPPAGHHFYRLIRP